MKWSFEDIEEIDERNEMAETKWEYRKMMRKSSPFSLHPYKFELILKFKNADFIQTLSIERGWMLDTSF